MLFHDGLGADVTAIINMTKPVAIVLPFLLMIAAIGSQFSAAVADNEGAGGLIEDITHHKVPMRYAYLLILLVTVTLTWETDVNGNHRIRFKGLRSVLHAAMYRGLYRCLADERGA